MDERRVEHDEDPRKADTGAGYPEEEPGGAAEGVQREKPPEREKGRGGAHAPSTSSASEGEPEQATGNPEAG